MSKRSLTPSASHSVLFHSESSSLVRVMTAKVDWRVACCLIFSMSLAEIQEAVKELTPEELTKLAAYISRQDKLGWDNQLEDDFSPGGKHAGILEKQDAEIDAGNHIAPVTSHALPSFWKCYDQLPQRVQKLGG